MPRGADIVERGSKKGRPRIGPTAIQKAGKGPGAVSLRDLTYLARAHSVEAVQVIITVMREGETQAIRMEAASRLLDRGYGRAPQAVAVAVDEGAGKVAEANALEIQRAILGALYGSQTIEGTAETPA